VTSSRRVLGLVDIAAFRGKKPLFLPMEVHAGFRQRHALHRGQLLVNAKQQIQILLDGGSEWIDFLRRSPLCSVCTFGRELHVMLLYFRRSLGDRDGSRGGIFDSGSAEIVGRSEAPSTIGNHPNPDAQRLGIRSAGNFSVLGRESATAFIHYARLRIGVASHGGYV